MKQITFIFRLIFIGIFFFLPSLAWAQFGNGWINFSQAYYKIPVIQDGVYRITKANLDAAGITGINPRQIQLFHRGVQHAIYVEGEIDNSLDSGDFIEFYGKRNDGFLDSNLYAVATRQVNKYYNLYSDTTAYFLTWTLDGTFGKRMDEVSAPVIENFAPYHWKEELIVYSDEYALGQNYPIPSNEDIYQSEFDNGEGWASTLIGSGQSRNISIPISSLYTPSIGSVKPILEIVMVGATKNVSNYNVEIRVGNSTSNLRLLSTVTHTNFQKTIFNTRPIATPNLELTDVNGTGQLIVRLTCTRGGVRMAYIKVTYPQTLNLNNAVSSKVGIPSNTNNISYLNISNPPPNTRILDISKLESIRRVNYNTLGGNLRVAFPHNFIEFPEEPIYNTLLISQNTVLTPLAIRPVTFQNINPNAHDYLIITHPRIRQAAGGSSDIVQAYADYRASVAGGSFSPLIVNINQLYDQFTFGEKTPLAIRRFANYMYSNGDPRFVLIIGKSISLPDQYFNSGTSFFLNIRKNFTDSQEDLVPSAGVPPSDIHMVRGLGNQGTFTLPIPIGRISANNAEQVLSYLNKVIEYEAGPCANALWQKHVLHLSGGNTESEQNQFKTILGNLGGIIKDTLSPIPPTLFSSGGLLAGKVFSQSKSTVSPTEVINISQSVNDGLGLITFFGHSTIGLTDVEIGRASDPTQGYQNQGKYPFMITNGCQLGAIFYNLPTLSTDWIFTANKGAIGFLGHSYLGYSGPLLNYSRRMYSQAFTNPNIFGKPIGEVMASSMASVGSNPNFQDETTIEQMILQGDPAVKFLKPGKTDYAITNSQLSLESVDGATISDLSESFNLKMIVSNFGMVDTQKETFSVRLERTYTTGEISTFISPENYRAVYYQDTLTLTVFREEDKSAFGLNQFKVTLDWDDRIDECDKDNNTATLEYFIPTIGVRPLIPTEFAIASAQPVTLTALVGNVDNQNREIIFEIDTVATFDSPAKQSQIVAPTANPTWDVTLLTDNTQDSTVYYWRVNVASAINDPTILWGESSFVYIKNSPDGWAQKRFYQFRKDRLSNLTRDENKETWKFTESIDRGLNINTYGSSFTPENPYVYFRYQGDAFITSIDACNQGMIAYRLTSSGDIFPPPTIAGTSRCGRNNLATYFDNTALQNNRLFTFIEQANENDYILIFTVGIVNFSAWTPAQKEIFKSIGGDPNLYTTLATGHPYAILGKKIFSPGTATEGIAFESPLSSEIQINPSISVLNDEGIITSTLIGPAQDWLEVIHKVEVKEGDSYQLDLYGVNNLNQESISPLIENITATTQDLSGISAEEYPRLRLKLKVKDETNRTPPQLKQWIVIYDGVPEGIIDVEAVAPNAYQILPKNQGENFTLPFVFRNITNLPFASDSLDVRLTLNGEELEIIKIKAPAPSESVQFFYEVSTLNLIGDNELIVFVNPRVVPEAFYENNVLPIRFQVNGDNTNPLLEVAFDGRRIMDGEIVAPEPLIGLVLRDDNRFLAASDPSNITMALKKPCNGCGFEEIDLTQNNISWSFESGTLKVDYKPERLEDGIHTLRVQGRDAAGNQAGIEPYTIKFEVINESSITHFYPYPNPFSTSTRFVFTLTGAEVPSQLKIQIMTVSGKVVREITQDEIGPIRIGNNISEYAWNGRDEFGDVLANGVYLYRVVMGSTQNSFSERTTFGDKAFKNGYGKMYILR
jgi:flagellar hook assembly protein FlgD